MSVLLTRSRPFSEVRRFQENRWLALPLMFLGLFALYTLATTAFLWQWMPHLQSVLIGPPEDNMNDFWNTYYAAAARQPGRFFFTNLIKFPEGTPLYYHDFAYPKVFAVALLSKLFGTDLPTLVLLHNLSVL